MVIKSKLLFSLLFVASCAVAVEKTADDYMKMSLRELERARDLAILAHNETPENKLACFLISRQGALQIMERRVKEDLAASSTKAEYEQSAEEYKQILAMNLQVEQEYFAARAVDHATKTHKEATTLIGCAKAKRSLVEAEKKMQKKS